MESKLPLFIVTGASGSGKTYVVEELRRIMPEFDVFDPDNIVEFIGHDWEKMRNIWLRVARNIAQSGRMTVICGTMMPWDIEKCVDYPYFKHVYYINLHCAEETRGKRLRERNWSEEMIQNHKDFAKVLLDIADKDFNPPMPTVDTTDTDVTIVASKIKDWILQYENRGIMSKFTLKAAMDYASIGDIEGWIHLFLNGEGANTGLSEGLKMHKRYWHGPIEVKIASLERVVGPEPHMEYVESEEWWNHNINQICERLESGWDMPPLIAENRNGKLSIRDGNHRLGALQKVMKETCFLIIWDDTSLENILQTLGAKHS